MSRHGAQWDDWDAGKKHAIQVAKKHAIQVAKKQQRIDGLKDLLKMWEPLDADHHEYVLELRAKLRAANNQMEAMCGT